MSPDIPRAKRTHAQYRTLDDLANDGIQLYLDKGGTLLHLKQPRMDCYGIRVVRRLDLPLLGGPSDLDDEHPVREFVIRTGNLKDGFQRACEHIAKLERENEHLHTQTNVMAQELPHDHGILAAEDEDSTTPQQHPDNRGVT